MSTFDVKAPDGRTFRVTAPEGASQDDVLARVKKEAARPGAYKDDYSIVGGALRDTFGMTDRPGKDTPAKHPWLLAGAAVPVVALGGAAAGAGAAALGAPAAVGALAPPIGRIATEAGIKAGTQYAEGKPITAPTIANIAEMAFGEVAGSQATRLLGKIALPAKNLQAIRERIMKATVGAGARPALDRLLERIASAPNEVAREMEIRRATAQLNAVEKGLGAAFKSFVVNAKAALPGPHWMRPHIPIGLAQTAGMAEDVTGSNLARAATDAALGQGKAGGMTLGDWALAVGFDKVKHVPGVGRFAEAVEEAVD